jgi:uncharacterized membrane protein HdeD (DUF308 family)
MRLSLVNNWWSLVLRGIVGILLGIMTFAWPGVTLLGIVLLFGAYALITGIVSLVGAVQAMQARERWGVLVLEGLIGIGAALVTMFWPKITLLALVYVIGVWAIITGVLEISAAIRLRRYIRGEWLLALAGVASVVFGFLIMMAPVAGALVIALWFGIYAFCFGVIMLILGIRLHSGRHIGFTRPSVIAPAH